VANVYHPLNVPILFRHALATDGESVWVNLYDKDRKILRVRARDSRVTDVYAVHTASGEAAMTFDGESLWVANGKAVAKLDPEDGSLLAQADVADGRVTLAHGGGAVWALNSGAGTLIKIRARDAEVVGEFPVALDTPVAMAYGSDALWIADRGTDEIIKYWAEDGTLAAKVSLVNMVAAYSPNGEVLLERRACQPLGLIHDGQSLWVSCLEDDTLRRYRARDGQFQSAIHVDETPTQQALAFDGTFLWVAGSQDRTLTRVRIDR